MDEKFDNLSRYFTCRCGNKHSCDVPVDSSIFGDPCPCTFKYIEVHYACRRSMSKYLIKVILFVNLQLAGRKPLCLYLCNDINA